MGVPFMTKDKKNAPDKAKTNKYSRRDFLTVGGTALAGGALAVYSPSKAEAKEEKEYSYVHTRICWEDIIS
jgi:hypothetical protein